MAAYVREGKLFGKSMMGRAKIDTDTFNTFNYKYEFNGKDDSAGYYTVTIFHYGEYIESMQTKCYTSGAAHVTREQLAKMDAALETVEMKPQKTEPKPKTDYSGKEISELVEIMDGKLQSFASKADSATFEEFVEVKEAIEAKINVLPLADRGAFSKPMSDINMIVTALRTQLSNPAIDVKQFLGTYVPQITGALAEIAAAAK